MRRWMHGLGLALLFSCGSSFSEWNEDSLESLEWREIGPYRGGRSAAVAGIPQDRETLYFGSTGGGVWKTSNGGGAWNDLKKLCCGTTAWKAPGRCRVSIPPRLPWMARTSP
jgi:hypothetical protein